MSSALADPAPADAEPGSAPGEDSPKRRAMLAAAGRLFLHGEGGYAATSMDAVAREAGVSKATLYAHFASKEALFGAVVGRRCEAMAAEATRVARHDREPREELRAAGAAWLRFLLEPETLAIHRTVVAEGPRFPGLARAFHEAGPAAGRRWMESWIAEEQRRGRLRADADPEVAASHLSAMLRGDLHLEATLGLLGADASVEARLAAAVEAANEAFLRAYGSVPAGSATALGTPAGTAAARSLP